METMSLVSAVILVLAVLVVAGTGAAVEEGECVTQALGKLSYATLAQRWGIFRFTPCLIGLKQHVHRRSPT